MNEYELLTPVELGVLLNIYHNPKQLQADYIRGNSKHVAKLASIGCITTYNGVTFGKTWLISNYGIATVYYNTEQQEST